MVITYFLLFNSSLFCQLTFNLAFDIIYYRLVFILIIM